MKNYLQPAVLGGVVTGVLSALPIVSAGNFCCCLWVVTGGLLASYLLQQNQSDAISAADGAIVGLLAGIFGATISFALSIPIGMLVGPVERQVLSRLRELSGNAEPSTPFGSSLGLFGAITFRIVAFVLMLVVASIVSTVAGVVGAALFGRARAPRAAS
ncbi:MAG TPA: hypothetical protein VM032_01145 [Vicinamibacterales bacterium]|nr:hypothetical protein [Vicinamibacterales bacterium]